MTKKLKLRSHLRGESFTPKYRVPLTFLEEYPHRELKVANEVLEQWYYKVGEDCFKNDANRA